MVEQLDQSRFRRIAHLSDLHFGRGFDKDLWRYVQATLSNEKPDVIVVSGDVVNSPWPLILFQAKKELNQLKQKCGARTLVLVPGNHDTGIWGNVRLWPFSILFRRIFYNDLSKLEAHIPNLFGDDGASRWRRAVQRLLVYPRITWWWFTRKLRDPGDKADHPKIYNEGHVWFAGLDSNQRFVGYVYCQFGNWPRDLLKIAKSFEFVSSSINHPGTPFRLWFELAYCTITPCQSAIPWLRKT